ncbi:MAG: sugar kinase [Spirochaetales bacterium]|nr:sugar kinase [Spirochaetales bacterium]
MFDLITFGEAMVRLSAPDFKRLEQTTTLDINIGGAEMNVAVAAARIGLKSSFVTALPSNPLGRMIANKAREHGVDTSHIVWSDNGRAGLYFVEFGSAPRGTAVLYDRADSALAQIQPDAVDWDKLFSNTRVFHTTGITPGVSDTAATVAMEALAEARRKKVLVSFDVNYRERLWNRERARAVLVPMLEYVDVLFVTESDITRVLGIEAGDSEKMARSIFEQFGTKVIVTTASGASIREGKAFAAAAYAGGRFYGERGYKVETVDRIGAGDTFVAGFLYSYLSDKTDIQQALQYGVAISALKHTFPGDISWINLDEVQRLIAEKESREISR